MTLTAIRSRTDSDSRPKSVVAVFEKYSGLRELLHRSRERAGESFSDYAEVQYALVTELTTDLQIALFGTDGHGRPNLPSVVVLIRRRKPQIPGQLWLFEMEEAA